VLDRDKILAVVHTTHSAADGTIVFEISSICLHDSVLPHYKELRDDL
jgi:hypothetical protein